MARQDIQATTIENRGIEELRVARYSDTAGLKGLDGMILRLWEIHTGSQFDASIAELGSCPLDDPSLVEEGSGESIPRTKTRYVTFKAGESVRGLYVLGSASAHNSDDGGSNEFTNLLCEILALWQPSRLVLPTFDRLVRSTHHASTIWRALEKYTTELVTATSYLRISDRGSEAHFMMNAVHSSFETQNVSARLLDGRLNGVDRGKTLMTWNQIPFGYRKNEDGMVDIVPGDKPLIEAIVLGVAAGDTPRQIVARVAQLGGTTPQLKDIYGPEATVANHGNPSELVKSWMGWMDLWETGKTEQAWKSSIRNQATYRGIELRQAPDEDVRYLIIPINWGVPEGGWVSADLMSECRLQWSKRRSGTIRRGATNHKLRRPLVGLSEWSDKNHDWRLFASGGLYLLRRRDTGTTNRPRGGWGKAGRPNGGIDGKIVARINSADLHRSIANGIAESISRGVSGEHTDTLRALNLRSAAHTDNAAAVNASELRALKAQQNNYISSLAHAESEDLRASIMVIADELQGKIAVLQHRANAQANRSEVESDASAVLAALSRLANVDGVTDSRLSDALHAIIEDLRFQRLDDGVEWSLNLIVPTHTGTLVLGPITGEVKRRAKKIYRRSIVERAGDFTQKLLTTSWTIADVVNNENGRNLDTYEGAIHGHLKDLGLGKRARILLVNSYVPVSASTVVWQHVSGGRVDAHHDSEWVRLVIASYTQTRQLPNARAFRERLVVNRAIMAHLIERGGHSSIEQLLASGIASRWHIDSAIKGRSGPTRCDLQPILRQDPQDRSRVTLIPCPHCRGWASVAHVLPDVVAGTLCPGCLKMPIADSPTFPQDYATA